MTNELETKLSRIQDMLTLHNLEALLLKGVDLLCGLNNLLF